MGVFSGETALVLIVNDHWTVPISWSISSRTSSGYRLLTQPSTTSMEKDKVAQEEIHRIRITLVSTNVKAVEKSTFLFTCILWVV